MPVFIWEEIFPTEAVDRLTGILSLIIVIFFLAGACFLGKICDRFKLSEKVALWDFARKNGLKKKIPAKLVIALILLLLYLITPFVYKAINTAIQTSRIEKYNETMSALGKFEIKDGTISLVEYNPQLLTAGAAKIAAYDLTEHTYTTKYVPEELLAEKVEEVGYILFFENSSELIGYYGNIGTDSQPAYQRYCVVYIMDCAQQEFVFNHTFYGSRPPSSISSESHKAQYGDEPDAQEIVKWVNEVMQDLLLRN